MIRSIFTGVLLFVVMVCTAVSVSHPVSQPGSGTGEFGIPASSTAIGGVQYSPILSGRTLDGSQHVTTMGDGGGLEENVFVIAFGLTFILCFAVGFWKYHQILEERSAQDEASKRAELKAACKTRVGKEIRQ